MSGFQLQFCGQTTVVKVVPQIVDAIGKTLAAHLGADQRYQVVVVTDTRVGRLYASRLVASLESSGFGVHVHAVDPGEGSKSLATVEQLYAFLAEHAVGRDAILLALGGGVVSDLCGFVAATWMRGVRFVICPTTLEADVDACLGGKTGVNLPAGKNLVGAFHQPTLVAVDPMCLHTLDDRDVRAGLAESIKHALISSDDFLSWHEAHASAILSLDDVVVTELIEKNLRIKGEIVEQDPLEECGRRIHLNFGHTIGHAIEMLCEYRLRHGECVALGMLAACRLSNMMGLLGAAQVARVEAILSRFALPDKLSEPISADAVLEAIRLDKKMRGGKVRFVLLESIGKPVVRDDVSEPMVRQAYGSLLPSGA